MFLWIFRSYSRQLYCFFQLPVSKLRDVTGSFQSRGKTYWLPEGPRDRELGPIVLSGACDSHSLPERSVGLQAKISSS